MANIMHFNPLHELAGFTPFGREMEDFFKGFFLTPVSFNQLTGGSVPINITEDEKSYKVRAEIPGFSREDIQVSVHGDQVSISAEMKKEKDEKKGDKIVLHECHYGKQFRSFTLPQAVDDAKTSAKYMDGILELVLPKARAAVTKKIVIE